MSRPVRSALLLRVGWRLGLVGLIAALLCAGSPTLATADTETIGYTGGPQTWTVPLGVHSVEFDLYGAAGSNNGNSGFVGGKGGRAKATFDVSPGQLMRLYIGGTGGFLAGGWNGGGHGFAGGGGGTDLRIGGTGLGNRVLVAGGGGGVGNYGGASRGGDGGGLVGTSGTSPTAGAPAPRPKAEPAPGRGRSARAAAEEDSVRGRRAAVVAVAITAAAPMTRRAAVAPGTGRPALSSRPAFATATARRSSPTPRSGTRWAWTSSVPGRGT